MDSAFLHGTVFNIEIKRNELEKQNLDRNEIKKQFEKKYRTFSKKHAFTCLCCNSPVSMNLTRDEGRPFYFKHFDGSECSYSENTTTYQKFKSNHEDQRKKDIGLTIFRNILEGQLKPFGVEIERGYLYRKRLTFIPDFILKFPYSDQIWAIDYFTSLSQNLTNGNYARNLEKRMNIYRNEGFKVLSFVDDSWLALDGETSKGTLLSSEKHVTRKQKEDYQWDEFLHKQLTKQQIDFLHEKIGMSNLEFDTKSIAYVNLDTRTCKIIRFLEFFQNEKNASFYKLSEPTIPLDRALSLNLQQDNFLLYREDEENLRLEFKNSLSHELEQVIKVREEEEALERNLQEERIHQDNEKKRKETQQRMFQEIVHTANEVSIDLEMQARAKAAANRPIDMSPEQWEWFKKTGTRHFRTASLKPLTSQKDIIPNKKREIFKEKILTHPIQGEMYIQGDTREWRGKLLKWVKENQDGEVLMVSIIKLLNDMKLAGVSFTQSDTLAQHPIKSFLEFYSKELKKDLKIKLEIVYK